MAEFVSRFRLLLFIEAVLALGLHEQALGESFTLQSVRSAALTVREGCKSVLTCKTDRPGPGVPIKWRRTGLRGPLTEVKFEKDGIRHNSMVFESVVYSDTGRYSCDIGNEESGSVDLTVLKGKMVLKNVTSSEHPRETIKFLVESCLPDVVVQFFRGPELLDSTTDPVEKGWLGTLQLKPGDIKSGDYACQAISDSANMVLQEFFSL